MRILFKNNGSENMEAFVHLDSGNGHDFTFCGLSLDGDPDTTGEFVELKRGKITCPDCIQMIKHARSVRLGSDHK